MCCAIKKNARSDANADDATVKRVTRIRVFFPPSQNSSDGFENVHCTTKHLNDPNVNVVEIRVANNSASTATTTDN